jgi:cytochrome b561
LVAKLTLARPPASLLTINNHLVIAAAIYHQFVLKTGLFRRMWFGERTMRQRHPT